MLPTIIFVLIVEVLLWRIDTSYDIKNKHVLRKFNEIETIIVGSSHAFQGINPKYLGGNSYNLANVSQDHFYDLKIIEKYQGLLVNLKRVIVPISYFSLQYSMSGSTEAYRQFFYSHGMGIFPEEMPLRMDLKNYSRLMLWDPRKLIDYCRRGFPVPPVDVNGFQEVAAVDGVHLNNGKERVDYHHTIMDKRFLHRNIAILEKIASDSAAHGIQVVFVVLPVYSSYSENCKSENLSLIDEVARRLASDYKFKYINYFNDKRFSPQDFADSDHFNVDGAYKFSKILAEDIGQYPASGNN